MNCQQIWQISRKKDLVKILKKKVFWGYFFLKHLVDLVNCRINIQIHSVSLTCLVSIHLFIHLSTHLSHHPRSHHPSLLHSFTPRSKPTFSTNPFHLRLLYLLDCLTITELDRTYHAHHIIFSFIF